MSPTKIEWTDETWNPTSGCSKVSEGCKNCYAERIAKRFWRGREFTDVKCHPERLEIPLHWKKPRKIFVDSMSDLFHDNVPDSFIYDVLNAAIDAPQHTYQILTKRVLRMCRFLEGNDEYALPNVWLGVSVENQKSADERIPWLMKTPAVVRFISYEPALGAVDFTDHILKDHEHINLKPAVINWIIAGGETGVGARPANPDWFRKVRDQCEEANVPFFFKGMGGQHKGIFLRVLDGREWKEFPKGES
jgi:protein gp37